MVGVFYSPRVRPNVWNRPGGGLAGVSRMGYRGGVIGYPRSGGTGRRLLSPRRPRQCGRRIPSLQDNSRGALGRRSGPLGCRLDPRWMGARGVR
jgi:hypothetical protein